MRATSSRLSQHFGPDSRYYGDWPFCWAHSGVTEYSTESMSSTKIIRAIVTTIVEILNLCPVVVQKRETTSMGWGSFQSFSEFVFPFTFNPSNHLAHRTKEDNLSINNFVSIFFRPVWARLDVTNKDLRRLWWPAEDAGIYIDRKRRQVYSQSDDIV